MRYKNTFIRLSNISGGALLAVLILIPVLAAGSLAVHYMLSHTGKVSMQAAAEQNAYVIAEGAADIVLSEIMRTPSLLKKIYLLDASTEPKITELLGTGIDPKPYAIPAKAQIYKKFNARYIIQKVPTRKDAPPNSMAILVTARLYDGDPSNKWDGTDKFPVIAEQSIYQEFNGGLVKVRGCAANYDIWAGNNYDQRYFFNFSWFQNLAYYAGTQWKSCGISAPFLGWFGTSCVDAPKNDGVLESLKTNCGCGILGMSCSICRSLSLASFFPVVHFVNCGAQVITFEEALGYNLIEDPDNPGNFASDDNITNINVNGNGSGADANYDDASGYPWNSLEKDVIDHISHDARPTNTHAAALAAMQGDADVGNIGNWYFRDTNHDNLPDIDTPYFYHEGDLINVLPFQIGMLRWRNVYFYVNGDVQQFQFAGNGSGLNHGNFYLIASRDIWTFDMTNMQMADAGVVVIAGRDITNINMMQGANFAALTMFANRDIQLQTGFKVTLATRTRLLASRDVISFKAFDASWFVSGNGQCGCPGIPDEKIDFAVGRRFGG